MIAPFSQRGGPIGVDNIRRRLLQMPPLWPALEASEAYSPSSVMLILPISLLGFADAGHSHSSREGGVAEADRGSGVCAAGSGAEGCAGAGTEIGGEEAGAGVSKNSDGAIP